MMKIMKMMKMMKMTANLNNNTNFVKYAVLRNYLYWYLDKYQFLNLKLIETVVQ
jgi:hypothetical protein